MPTERLLASSRTKREKVYHKEESTTASATSKGKEATQD
jgi:hypothetical protein